MIIDSQNELSDAQAVTATAISENVIDLGEVNSNFGAGTPLYLFLAVGDTDFEGQGSTTLTATIESDSVAGLSSSPTTHFTTEAIDEGDLTAGAVIAKIALPRGTYQQYLGARYTIGSGPMTAGNVNAFIAPDLSDDDVYPVGYTIS